MLPNLVVLAMSLVADPPPPGLTDTPNGIRVPLIAGATLFVPRGYRPPAIGRIDIVVHLHGASTVVEPAMIESRLPGVLVVFNRKGLSSVYTKPFSDPSLFPRLLDDAVAAVKRLGLADNPKVGRVVVSAFSAGFGGVRELLEVPATFDRIDGVVLADSLYCGYAGDPAAKRVDPALMAGFERFAREAAAGRKTMLLSHSAQVPQGYASTTETADALMAAVAAPVRPKTETWADDWTQTREAFRGRFLVVGFAGTEAADHMSHLRQIAKLWQRFQAIDGPGR